jgi:NAD(P)-dependent dehydrogenase (short-subunit alcohol dehydrogenase family)
MGSVAGLQAGYGPYPYSAAKAAIAHLTQCAAMELAEGGVRVTCVCPGAIPTPLFGKSFGMNQAAAETTVPALVAAFPRMQPIARSGQPLDIARCALWLASDESSFVTGQTLVVDGGLTSGRSWAASQATRAQLMAALGLEGTAKT